MILNLGCGRLPLEGTVNHDKKKYFDHVDIAHDLDEYPWPWEDEEFDEIYAAAVLEHLKDLVKSLEECHRILKLGCQIHIQVPHWQSQVAHDDPTHRWFLTPRSMDYFIEGTAYGDNYGFYSTMRWKKISCEIIGNDVWFVLEKMESTEDYE